MRKLQGYVIHVSQDFADLFRRHFLGRQFGKANGSGVVLFENITPKLIAFANSVLF
jgi:hypothetical protein